MLTSLIFSHFVAERFQHLLEFVLGCIGRPGIDPMLNDFFAEFTLDIADVAWNRDLRGGGGGRTHSTYVTKAFIQMRNNPAKNDKITFLLVKILRLFTKIKTNKHCDLTEKSTFKNWYFFSSKCLKHEILEKKCETVLNNFVSFCRTVPSSCRLNLNKALK